MTKRANGEGNVRRRANGGWEARLSVTDTETGRTERVSFYAPTAKAARAKMTAARSRLEAGAPVKDATRTVADWLSHWRATTLAASDRKESTRALYATLSRKHLEVAPFGLITLDRLRPSDIEAMVLACRERGLSDSSVRQIYTVARLALDGAVRDGLLARNPAALVARPGVARTEARHLGAGDVTAVLRAAESSRHHPALVLIAATGLRKGECLALRWEHVDLDAGALKVVGTLGRICGRLVSSEPKTDRSRRTVPLNPAVVALLRAHRTAQKADRLRAGDQWTDSGLVFTTELGAPVDPRNLLRVLEAAAQAAGAAGAGVHTLRHSAVVAWLEAGVHIRQVADLLGHSSVAITGDVYGHGSDDGARAAVDHLAGRLGL
jgi:integrase